jgi:hypothetical protein
MLSDVVLRITTVYCKAKSGRDNRSTAPNIVHRWLIVLFVMTVVSHSVFGPL